MKKFVLLFLMISFCLSNQLIGQWTTKTFNLSNYMVAKQLEFGNEDNGIILAADVNLNYFVGHTNNGGDTWTKIYSSATSTAWIKSVDMIGSDHVYIAVTDQSSYNMMKSTDGGLNLTTIPLSFYPDKIQFLNQNVGYALSNNTIMKTIDGANNWTSVGLPSFTGGIRDIQFIDQNIGYILVSIINSTSEIFKTTDAGANWNSMNIFTDDIHEMHFYDENTGVVYTPYEIYYTNNSTTWSQSTINNLSSIKDVKMVSPTVGFAADIKYILKTTDGGQNWAVNKDYSNDWFFLPSAVSFPTSTTGYVAGGSQKFVKTTNAGGNSVGFDQITAQGFNLWPNPASEMMTINFNDLIITGDLNLEIYNSLGQLVYNNSIDRATKNWSMNLNAFTDGVYLLYLKDENQVFSTKLIIQR